MSTLLETIKKDRIEAIKAKNEPVKSVLTVLVGEIDRNRGNKELTDEVVIATIVKMCKSSEETIAMLPKDADTAEQKLILDILSKYRPQLKNAKETRDIIMSIIERYDAVKIGSSNFGIVMKELKSHTGIDMKIASGIVKELMG